MRVSARYNQPHSRTSAVDVGHNTYIGQGQRWSYLRRAHSTVALALVIEEKLGLKFSFRRLEAALTQARAYDDCALEFVTWNEYTGS